MEKDLKEIEQKLIDFYNKYNCYITDISNVAKSNEDGKLEVISVGFKIIYRGEK